MLNRFLFIVLIVAGSTGCRSGPTGLSQEELRVLIRPGMQASNALQILSGRGYQVKGPEIRDLVLYDLDSNAEMQCREWNQRNIATCEISLDSNPIDLVTGSNSIYVVIDDNNRVEETISRTVGF